MGKSNFDPTRYWAQLELGRAAQHLADTTWIGFAEVNTLKVVVAGWVEWKGTMWNVGDPARRMCTWESTIRHLGGGVAAGKSLHAVAFLNTRNLAKLEGKSFGGGRDWNFGVPAHKLASLAFAAQRLYKLGKAAVDARELADLAVSLAEGIVTQEPTIITRQVADGTMGAALTVGFQGQIDIRKVIGRGGYIDNL